MKKCQASMFWPNLSSGPPCAQPSMCSTYLPLKAIGDVLGVPVQWNEKLRRVEVGSISNTKNEYSFNNPAPLNTIQTITKESFLQKYTAEVVVKEIVRGETANKMVADANIFNDPPKEGYEYLLAKVYVKLISIDEGALTLSPLQFSLISSDGKEYDMPFVVLPEPEITTTLYPGASHEGWVVFEVKKEHGLKAGLIDNTFEFPFCVEVPLKTFNGSKWANRVENKLTFDDVR